MFTKTKNYKFYFDMNPRGSRECFYYNFVKYLTPNISGNIENPYIIIVYAGNINNDCNYLISEKLLSVIVYFLNRQEISSVEELYVKVSYS